MISRYSASMLFNFGFIVTNFSSHAESQQRWIPLSPRFLIPLKTYFYWEADDDTLQEACRPMSRYEIGNTRTSNGVNDRNDSISPESDLLSEWVHRCLLQCCRYVNRFLLFLPTCHKILEVLGCNKSSILFHHSSISLKIDSCSRLDLLNSSQREIKVKY